MDIYIECRICLRVFSDNDSVHVETKVINQKNVLQAIEEIASIEALENDGLPEHVCVNCFKSLESSITFRTQIISSDIELKRRTLTGKRSLDEVNDAFLCNTDKKAEDDEYKDDVKEESNELDTLLLENNKDIPVEHQEKEDNDASLKSSEGSDQNGFSEDNISSDDNFRKKLHKNSLRNSRVKRRSKKTDSNHVNVSVYKEILTVGEKDKPDISAENDNVLNNKLKKKTSLNCSNNKSTIPDRKWSDFSDSNSSSESFSNEEIKNKPSLKQSKKKPAVETRKVRRKKRVAKRIIENISDTSDSDSDSDIPLEELRKEIKDLENKTEPKVKKKRQKKEIVDGPRLCPICGKLFKARQNFNSHMTTVHRKKPEKPEKISCLCPDCGRVITGTRQNFVAHRRYHHSDKAQVKKRFACDVCPRKFYREKNLIIHQRIHKGEKGYVCELCPDKSYTQIGGLILHKRKVHLKKPTCTCNYCGKQFYEKHYLETHIRQWHTGERPFSCEICGKSFSCNGTLLRHRKDSHGEKQPCPKCGKMYTEGELRKHLKRHKIREEGIKRKKYTCEYCGTEMNFTSRKRHLLKQHGIMLRGRGETAERVPISRADAM